MTVSSRFRNPHAAALFDKLQSRSARTGVVGLGYVGLPLAIELGRAGFSVVGIEVDQEKRETLNRGKSHVDGVADYEVAELVDRGRLSAVNDYGACEPLDTVSICVPTPLGEARDPDVSYVVAAARALKARLRPGILVVLESTTYPGTTEELLRGILEETGLKAGVDFFLAYSPERVDPGLPGTVLRPRVVGGLTSDCAVLAEALYRTFVESVTVVSAPRAAEMTKLLENSFRAVNIGFVNEIAKMCEGLGINVWEVVEAAATKPAGFMAFYPGPGLGGHCIPIDPFYLSWKARKLSLDARFIELAGEVNESMPRHMVDLVTDALNSHGKAVKGSQIFVIGVAYKRDVDDVRESPALDVIGGLLQKGGVVSYHDPFVPEIAVNNRTKRNVIISSTPLTQGAVERADCVVVLTNHSVFDYDWILSYSQLLVDAHNVVKERSQHVFTLGVPSPNGAGSGMFDD